MEGKIRQEDYWGGPEWQRSYSRRSRVEASFALVKSAKGHGVRRGWTHQVGQAKTTFALTLVLTAVNLDRLVGWAQRTGYTLDPLTSVDVSTAGFREVDVDLDALLPAALPKSA